jgi:hypothetical protein
MGDARHKASSRGPRYLMTSDWKALVIERMRERGINRTQLAKLAGVTKGAITTMLSDGQATSIAVPAVARALGLPMPIAHDDDELVALVQGLDPDNKRLVLDLARKLTRPRE